MDPLVAKGRLDLGAPGDPRVCPVLTGAVDPPAQLATLVPRGTVETQDLPAERAAQAGQDDVGCLDHPAGRDQPAAPAPPVPGDQTDPPAERDHPALLVPEVHEDHPVPLDIPDLLDPRARMVVLAMMPSIVLVLGRAAS